MKLTSWVKALFIISMLVTTTAKINAQTFVDQTKGAKLDGISTGEGQWVWGDYDNDGDLDLLMAGEETISGTVTYVTRIYKNDNGKFTPVASSTAADTTNSILFTPYGKRQNPTGVRLPAIAWLDYNNDGYLDFVVTGSTGTSSTSLSFKLYKNNGNGTFTDVTYDAAHVGDPKYSAFPTAPLAVTGGYFAIGDVNNDGYTDIIYNGLNSSTEASKTQIVAWWQNNGNGTFKSMAHSFSVGGGGACSLVDINNDGYLDLYIAGYPGTGNFHINNGDGTFTYKGSLGVAPTGSGNGATRSGFCTFGDYNNDGFMDMLCDGNNNTTSSLTSKVNHTLYINYYDSVGWGNSKTTTFTSKQTFPIIGWNAYPTFREGYQSFYDYDNDGNLDLIFAGLNSAPIVKVYHNGGAANNYVFTEVSSASLFPGGLTGVTSPSIQWGDYDGDGKVDLFYAGITNSSKIAVGQAWLYKNVGTAINTKPIAVDGSGMSATVAGSTVTFKWNKTQDKTADGSKEETPQNSLTYNLRLGTSSEGGEIRSGLATSDGIRTVAVPGSIVNQDGAQISYIMKGLKQGSYYWSVQAIDGQLGASLWATEGSFVISSVQASLIHPDSLSHVPVVGRDSMRIVFTKGNEPYRMVMAYEGSVSAVPAMIDTFMTANAKFGTVGTQYRSTGWYCVYNGSNNTKYATDTIVIRNLKEATNYTVAAIGYYGTYPNVILNTGNNTDNPKTISTRPYYTQTTITKAPGASGSSVAWADYNNDGNLDFVMIGDTTAGTKNITAIFKGNGDGTFTRQTSIKNLAGFKSGSVAWGDYDNDGYLDLLISGIGASGNYIKVYKNNGNNTFTEKVSNLLTTGLYNGTAQWGDFDRDGKLDILLYGYTTVGSNATPIIAIYKNNGDGTFSDTKSVTFTKGESLGSIKTTSAIAAVGDYNSDGNLDFFYAGANASCQLYKANGDLSFKNISTDIPYFDYGTASWADYDNDGKLDLLVMGNLNTNTTLTSSTSVAKLYQYNDKGGVFTEQTSISLPALRFPSVAWGDFNNDGYLDMLITGTNTSNVVVTYLYKNSGGTSPTFSLCTGFTSAAITQGSATFADYNKDGRLEFLLVGSTAATPASGTLVAYAYSTADVPVNTAPTAPSSLSASVKNSAVTLNWASASDDNTPAAALNYNVRIGTASGLNDVVSGARGDQMFGNANTQDSITYKGLKAGTYYWSVQAIDKGFMAGNWSAEQTFTVTDQQASNIVLSNLTRNSVKINWTRGNGNKCAVFIVNGNKSMPKPNNNETYKADTVYKKGSQVVTIQDINTDYSGWYCVYNGSDRNFVTVTGMDFNNTNGGVFRVAVVEYNDNGTGTITYNTSSAANNPVTNYIQPTKKAAVIFTDVQPEQFSLSISGGGSKHAVFISPDTTGYGIKPITVRPLSWARVASPQNIPNDTTFQANGYINTFRDLKSWTRFRNTSWYCAYNGDATTPTIYGLNGKTRYNVKVVEYNGAPGSEKYLLEDSLAYLKGSDLVDTVTAGYTTPTVQTIGLGISGVSATGATITIGTKGNGWSRNVFMTEFPTPASSTDTINAQPIVVNGTTYSSSNGGSSTVGAAVYKGGTSSNISGTKGTTWNCVQNITDGTGKAFPVSGLQPNTKYIVKSVEFSGNNTAGFQVYSSVADTIGNPVTFTTPFGVPKQATALTAVVKPESVALSCTNGTGSNRIIYIIKSTAAVTASPTNDTTYTANSVFGQGKQVSYGWYNVYNGSSNSVNVTGLTAKTIYYAKVCDYNGTPGRERYATVDTTVGTTSNIITFTTSDYVVPTTQASALVLSASTNNPQVVNATWTRGNGSYCVLFAAKVSTGTVAPVADKTYVPNSVFTKGDQVGTSGWFTVYNGTGTSASISGLDGTSTYRFMVCEYNAAASSPYLPKYNTTSVSGNILNITSSDYPAPTRRASNITVSDLRSNRATISYNKGNGNKHLVLIIDNANAASSIYPTFTNNVTVSTSSVYGGATVGSWSAVYNGADTAVTVTGLSMNTAYKVKVIEFNGNLSSGLEKYGNTADTTANNPLVFTTGGVGVPASQASNIVFNLITPTQMNISWTPGNGGKRAVFVYQDTAKVTAAYAGSVDPVANVTYSAGNGVFGQGSKMGSTNWYCVYNGSDNNVIVTGLTPYMRYRVKVCEYNGVAGSEQYLGTDGTGNPVSAFTSPVTQTTGLSVGSVKSASFKAAWTKGSGVFRAVFVKQGATDGTLPVNKVVYTANSTFGMGTQIASTGWYCVYNDSIGKSLTVSGLNPGTVYSVASFEYVGDFGTPSLNPIYNMDLTSKNSVSFTSEYLKPAVQAINVTVTGIKAAEAKIAWTKGDGNRRAVFIYQGDRGLAVPSNNTTYTANTVFGNGSQIGATKWYCIYDGTGSETTVTGLSSLSDYLVMVCEYNGLASMEKYLSTSSTNNPVQFTTDYAAPLVQSSDIVVSNVKTNQFTLTWTNGSGTNRAVFVTKGTSGYVTPIENTTYVANASFGSGTVVAGTTWYCLYNGSANTVTVTGLDPQSDYRAMVLDYNGTVGLEKYSSAITFGNPANVTTSLPATGIEDVAQKDIKIYPNPVVDKLSVSFGTFKIGTTITVSSLSGAIISVTKAESSITEINMSNLASGIYIVKIANADGVIVKQVVKL